MKHVFWLTCSSILLILAACGPAGEGTRAVESVSTVNVASPGSQAYPALSESDGEGGYPSPADERQGSEQAYPAPEPGVVENRAFTIESVQESDTSIRGSGLPDAPIKVVSVSRVGEVLGFGVVDTAGRFEIELLEPLEAATMIGLQVSDPAIENDYRETPGATDIPLIGLVLATAVVQS